MQIRSVTKQNLVESRSHYWDVVDVYELKLFEAFEDSFDAVFGEVLAVSQLQFFQDCGGLAKSGDTSVKYILQTVKLGDL